MGNIKKVPLRKCIGCNEMKNKKEMMRVLKTPEGEIVLDVTGTRKIWYASYAQQRMKSCWMPLAGKTVAAHIFVSQRNVFRKPSRTKGWNVP